MRKLLFTFFLFFSLSNFCQAQFDALFYFNGTNGSYPSGTLVLLGNRLYGTTQGGGAHNYGCIFSVDVNGNRYKDLHDFDSVHGSYPPGSLTLAGNTFYGVTTSGGLHNGGTIFSIDTDGTRFKVLLYFTNANPYVALTLSGKRLYGSSNFSLFCIDTNGNNFKNLSNIQSEGKLILSGNALYGMTSSGGKYSNGFVFATDTDNYRTRDLLDFNDTNGKTPNFDALLLSGGTLYGMVTKGGAHDSGLVFSIDTNGTGYTDLHDFDGRNGGYPEGALTLLGNTLIGTTYEGGINNYGCIFSIQTNGTGYHNLYDFIYASGTNPLNLALTPSGNTLYGTASFRGINYGTIFGYNYNDLGIDNLSANNSSVNVYPNPSSGEFAFSCHSEQSEESNPMIEVYNVLGERILAQTLRFAQGDNGINLSSQPNGIYLYRVITTGGNLVGEGKLAIQR